MVNKRVKKERIKKITRADEQIERLVCALEKIGNEMEKQNKTIESFSNIMVMIAKSDIIKNKEVGDADGKKTG